MHRGLKLLFLLPTVVLLPCLTQSEEPEKIRKTADNDRLSGKRDVSSTNGIIIGV